MYKPHEFAKKLGVTVKTLQRWDSSGKLPAKRTAIVPKTEPKIPFENTIFAPAMPTAGYPYA